jgi:uncharacterized protein (TIGR02677 family)
MTDAGRFDLYRYAVADNRDEYRALLRAFTSTLLTDLSASEAVALLTGQGITLTVDEVTARCEQLESWGNLVRSVRDSHVATVAEYLRSRSRYQVSKLGGRVHRQVEDVAATADGAREVARELLGGIADTLGRIRARVDTPNVDPEALAADVTTVFNNQALFQDSVRDFYAYLHQVLARYDLAGSEYATFKTLLLDYVDLISADVARHSPAVTAALDAVNARRDALLAALASLPGLDTAGAGTVERLPGRTAEDWDRLTAWYDQSTGRSGPDQLRSAAQQALGQLLANAKRMLAASGTGVSRRADLLRLARWMHTADTDTAHRLFNAAFGAYPARHLLLGPDQIDPRTPVTGSWWSTGTVEVPVSLRERGDRAAIGRTSPVPNPAAERAAVEAEAAEEAAALAVAVAELVAVGGLTHARLTPAARDVVLDQLAAVLALHQGALHAPVTVADPALGLTLVVSPSEHDTVVTSPDGTLTVHGLELHVHPFEASDGQAEVTA